MAELLWAREHIKRLQAGETVQFRRFSDSMSGRIEAGQLCTVTPVHPDHVQVGDVVLVRVRGRDYLHLIHAIKADRVQVADNHGFVNGWTKRVNIYGKLVSVE